VTQQAILITSRRPPDNRRTPVLWWYLLRRSSLTAGLLWVISVVVPAIGGVLHWIKLRPVVSLLPSPCGVFAGTDPCDTLKGVLASGLQEINFDALVYCLASTALTAGVLGPLIGFLFVRLRAESTILYAPDADPADAATAQPAGGKLVAFTVIATSLYVATVVGLFRGTFWLDFLLGEPRGPYVVGLVIFVIALLFNTALLTLASYASLKAFGPVATARAAGQATP